jgi:Mce-associated membrane protein
MARDSEGSAAVEYPDPDREVTPGAGVSRSKGRGRLVVFTMLPIVALIAAAAVGFLKWQATSMQEAQEAATDSVQFATDTTIKMLFYRPDTVEQDLGAARDRLTGTFRDDYTKLTKHVVIPGAKEKKISPVATVPAVSSVSATANRAVVLVFVNQTVIVGSDPPSSTASSVRMTLQRSNGQWLVSSFDPI